MNEKIITVLQDQICYVPFKWMFFFPFFFKCKKIKLRFLKHILKLSAFIINNKVMDYASTHVNIWKQYSKKRNSR